MSQAIEVYTTQHINWRGCSQLGKIFCIQCESPDCTIMPIRGIMKQNQDSVLKVLSTGYVNLFYLPVRI